MPAEFTPEEIWEEARRRFAGHQVVSFQTAFDLLERKPDSEMDNPDGWEGLLIVLKALGYRHRWIEDTKTGAVNQLFSREIWPGDVEAWTERGSRKYKVL